MKNVPHFFTYHDLLLLPSIRSAVILSGKSALYTPIEKLHFISDMGSHPVPEAGDLLLINKSTDSSAVDEIADTISENNKNFGMLISIPINLRSTTLQAFLSYDIPIIQMTSETVNHQILSDITSQMITAQEKMLLFTQNLLEEVSNVSSSSQSAERIIRTVEQRINRRILVIHRMNLLTSDDIVPDHLLFFQDNELSLEKGGIQQLLINDVIVKAYVFLHSDMPKTKIIFLESNLLFSDSSLYVINTIGLSLCYIINNLQTAQELSFMGQDHFLLSWLSGDYPLRIELANIAKANGVMIYARDKCRVIIVDTLQSSDPININNLSLYYLRKYLISHFDGVYLTIKEKLTLIIRCIQEENDENESARFRELYDSLSRLLQSKSLFFAVSSNGNIDEAPHLYEEANYICSISYKSRFRIPIMYYRDLGIRAIMAPLSDSTNARLYCSNIIGSLIQHDMVHKSCLLQTLRTYYKTDSNIKLTAEKMFTHYNTIRYRLQKIKDVLNLDIDNPSNKLELQIALYLNMFLTEGGIEEEPNT